MRPVSLSPELHSRLFYLAAVALLLSFAAIVAFAWAGKTSPVELKIVLTASLAATIGLPLSPSASEEDASEARDALDTPFQ